MHSKPPSGIGRIGLRALYVICAGLFLVDFIYHRHAVHPLSQWPGFYVLYGVIACIVLVFGAGALRKALMRKEGYYEDEALDAEALDEAPSPPDRFESDEKR